MEAQKKDKERAEQELAKKEAALNEKEKNLIDMKAKAEAELELKRNQLTAEQYEAEK